VILPNFRRLFYRLTPWWLNTGEGELVNFSLGAMHDAMSERARQSVHARFPATTPPDALPRMGRDRKIIRGFNEPEATYRLRLLRWLDDHRVRGNPYKLMAQLRAYLTGYAVPMRTVDNRGNWYSVAADGTRSVVLDQGNWDWDGSPALWSRFWVILYPPADLWTEGPNIGDADLWGGAVGGNGAGIYTIGSTATPEQVKSIRSIVRQWKPAGTHCVRIIVAFDPASFDPADPPGPPLPDGTWKNHGTGYPVRLAARLQTARYWRGTS
jgi:hypothetical protein